MWHSDTALHQRTGLETATTPITTDRGTPHTEDTPSRRSLLPTSQISRGQAFIFGIGWPVVLLVNMAVEPQATEPPAIALAVGTVLFLAFATAMIATVMAAARRSPMTPLRSTWAGGLGLIVTLGCPISGHHAGIGPWWFSQMALSLAMLAVSVLFLRRSPGAESP